MMHQAALSGNTYILTFLHEQLDNRLFDADDNGDTPLHYACSCKSESSSLWLLAFGADVNTQNKKGDTPLHQLMSNSEQFKTSKQLKDLIYHGAKRNIQNNNDNTPLSILLEE